MKKTLFSALATLGMVAIYSCSPSEFSLPEQYDTTPEEYKQSFIANIGNIHPNQDWNIIDTHTARVTVNLGLASTYQVGVFKKNPLTNEYPEVVAAQTVEEGQTAVLNFSAPINQTKFYVGVYDPQNYGVVEIIDYTYTDDVELTVGGTTVGTRASSGDADYALFARSLADYMHDLTDATMQAYTPFTDSDLSGNNNTLSNGNWTWSAERGSYQAFIGDGDGLHYRVAAGTTVQHSFNINGGWSRDAAVIYVQGKLVLQPENALGSVTLVVANGGELYVNGRSQFSGPCRILVEQGGRVTGANGASLQFNNGCDESYNAGTIDYPGSLLCNGGTFYNAGTIELSAFDGNSGALVINFGKLHAKSSEANNNAYNTTYINGCYIHFDGDAGFKEMMMLNNSRVDVGGTCYVASNYEMHNQSMLSAGALHLNYCSFNGPSESGQFAIIKCNMFLIANGYDGTFNNNVYVDGEVSYRTVLKHDGSPDPDQNEWSFATVFINRITKFTSESSSALVIPAGECTGSGYAAGTVPATTPSTPSTPVEEPEPSTPEPSTPSTDPEPSVDPEPEPEPAVTQRPVIESKIENSPVYYTIAFEDLGSIGDFDFNDIVLLITYYVTQKKALVELVAAGGKLPITVRYDGNTLFSKNSTEMINTTYRGAVIASCELSNFEATKEQLRNFSIAVRKNDNTRYISSASERGDAALALVIPGKWDWPREGMGIVKSYPEFVKWVESTNNIDWYENPDTNYIVK